MNFVRAFLFFVATMLLYLGVPLIGWGLMDLQGFFSDPPRLGYALVVGCFSLAVGIQAYGSTLGIRGSKGEQGKFVFRQHVVRILLIFILYVALIFIPYSDRHNIGVILVLADLRWLGVALSFLGFSLIFLSGLALGRQYSQDVTIQKDHQLVIGGVYRFIRHPRYIGIILLAIGFSLGFRSWIGLITSGICTLVLLYRIGDEELTMHKEFGQQWESYCQRSWRLIPYVY